MTEAPDTEQEPPRSALYRHVEKQVRALQEGYAQDLSSAVAALAKLRRGVGKQPGELAELAQWTAPGIFVHNYRSDDIAPEEYAAHAALTLFAMHQQGHRNDYMHRTGRSLGEAARELRSALGEHGEAGVLRRFNAIGTASDFAELLRHARGLVQQLRANKICLDYAMFADDLRKLMDPATAPGVRNRWGRHFYRPRQAADSESAPSAEGANRTG